MNYLLSGLTKSNQSMD